MCETLFSSITCLEDALQLIKIANQQVAVVILVGSATKKMQNGPLASPVALLALMLMITRITGHRGLARLLTEPAWRSRLTQVQIHCQHQAQALASNKRHLQARQWLNMDNLL